MVFDFKAYVVPVTPIAMNRGTTGRAAGGRGRLGRTTWKAKVSKAWLSLSLLLWPFWVT